MASAHFPVDVAPVRNWAICSPSMPLRGGRLRVDGGPIEVHFGRLTLRCAYSFLPSFERKTWNSLLPKRCLTPGASPSIARPRASTRQPATLRDEQEFRQRLESELEKERKAVPQAEVEFEEAKLSVDAERKDRKHVEKGLIPSLVSAHRLELDLEEERNARPRAEAALEQAHSAREQAKAALELQMVTSEAAFDEQRSVRNGVQRELHDQRLAQEQQAREVFRWEQAAASEPAQDSSVSNQPVLL